MFGAVVRNVRLDHIETYLEYIRQKQNIYTKKNVYLHTAFLSLILIEYS